MPEKNTGEQEFEMKIDALMLDPKDNVVTCVRDVAAGRRMIS